MALSPAQQTIADSPARFRVAISGRRFGKTYLSTRELARFARIPDRRCWYIAPSYRMARQIVWEPLKTRLIDLRWVDRINESDLTIRLINGSSITLRGADNRDSLRGVGLDFLVMDEFAWMDPKTWREVLRPTLSDRSGHAMFISTPVGKNNWAYELFQQAQEDPANWASFQYTSLDGGRISSEEIEQARADLDLRSFRQEYLASFEDYAGRIYYAFSDENVIRFDQAVPRDIEVYCDFNVNPISAVVAVDLGQHRHIIDEVVIYGSNTDELVQEISQRYPGHRVTAYPDPAGQQRKTSAGGRTDISILENAGWRVRYRRQHPTVRDRINAVNAAWCNTDSERYLLIDPGCRRTRESFDKHAYKEGTQIPDKDSGWDHMTDAVGYGIEYLKPLRTQRPDQPAQTARWGHRLAEPGQKVRI